MVIALVSWSGLDPSMLANLKILLFFSKRRYWLFFSKFLRSYETMRVYMWLSPVIEKCHISKKKGNPLHFGGFCRPFAFFLRTALYGLAIIYILQN